MQLYKIDDALRAGFGWETGAVSKRGMRSAWRRQALELADERCGCESRAVG